MAPLAPGAIAPPIPGRVELDAPRVLFFYKVTCPVCQMAAPKVEAFERAYPGLIVGIGEDPPEKLATFARQHGTSFHVVPDVAPYLLSSAFGLRTVPTTFLVDADGTILDTVESWDREGLNRVSRRLSDLVGAPYAPISEAGDGLPRFKPG
jgi:peroxiredoxin